MTAYGLCIRSVEVPLIEQKSLANEGTGGCYLVRWGAVLSIGDVFSSLQTIGVCRDTYRILMDPGSEGWREKGERVVTSGWDDTPVPTQ